MTKQIYKSALPLLNWFWGSPLWCLLSPWLGPPPTCTIWTFASTNCSILVKDWIWLWHFSWDHYNRFYSHPRVPIWSLLIVAPLENVDLRVGGEVRVGVDLEGEEGDELGKEPLVHVLAHLVQHKPVADAAKKVGSDVDSIAASLFVWNWLSWQIVLNSIRW